MTRAAPSSLAVKPDLIERARDLAHHLEKEAARPGAASVIHDLVAEIERLRNSLVET